MSAQPQPELVIRKAKLEDALSCGQICFDAFSRINDAHGFPCDFPNPAFPQGVMAMMFSHPGFYCVVADFGGQIAGSNCMDERSIIFGVGPITVNPEVQNQGAGRRLMQAVVDRANEQGAAGVRLVQAAFHNRSLSLYASLGFSVREPLSCMQGRTRQRELPGCTVRAATLSDVDRCSAISKQVHGFERGGELADAIQQNMAVVVEREGRITGYASSLAFWGHTTAETKP